MKKALPLEKIKTGVSNFDALLQGGLPVHSVTIIGGSPGTGKTILSQQIGFQNATEEKPVIYFQTLSEPTAKTLTYVSQFNFFDQAKIGKSVHFIDLGDILRSEGFGPAITLFIDHLKKIKPAFVVIDSFKAFEDLTPSPEELRKFSYEVAIQLMAWECTSLLLGEFGKADIESSPLFSIVDGIVVMSQRLEFGEQHRFLQIIKLRGTQHDQNEHAIKISEEGVDIFTPRLTLRRNKKGGFETGPLPRLKPGSRTLDLLIEEGIPLGSSCLVSGKAGTGKSLLCLEFLYRGAKEFNQKGVLFLFEETAERAFMAASNMGWDLAGQAKRGMIEVVSIPQPDIMVEMHLLMIHDVIVRLGAKRIVIDSTSVLLHKITLERVIREKFYQLTTIVQNVGGVGLFVADIPSGTRQISHYNVEETLVDGVILLTSKKIGQKRERSIEIYKMRNTSHKSGSYKICISPTGIDVLPGRES